LGYREGVVEKTSMRQEELIKKLLLEHEQVQIIIKEDVDALMQLETEVSKMTKDCKRYL
jgi:hypothetical protein